MPHFSLQLGPGGALVDAFVTVSEGRASALTASGQPTPQPQRIRALIDTGATGSCVDPAVLAALNLTPTGSVPVFTPTTGATPVNCNQYDVGLIIPAGPHLPFILRTIPVTEHVLFASQGFHALIGRDVLAHCLFLYNGQSGFFTVAY